MIWEQVEIEEVIDDVEWKEVNLEFDNQEQEEE